MLSKWNGIAEDTQGTEFHYTCYKTSAGCDKITYKPIFEILYICTEFPELRANTLNELKIKVGEV